MKRKSLLLLALFILLTTPCQHLYAWGQEGHRIIAELAYRHLTPKARRHIDKVLGPRGMVWWANWPDEIKSDTIYPNSFDWHFQDLDAGLSDADLTDMLTHYPAVGGNLFRATDSLRHVLEVHPEQVDALRFLIHLEGDRFCPMHTAHLDDKGGNTIRVKWFGSDTNLHAVWDSGIIAARGYTYTEYADCLEALYHDSIPAIQNMSREQVLLACYQLTCDIYAYQSEWSGNAYHYVYHYAPRMEWQLYAAGIRLAQLLNQLY